MTTPVKEADVRAAARANGYAVRRVRTQDGNEARFSLYGFVHPDTGRVLKGTRPVLDRVSLTEVATFLFVRPMM